MHGGLLCVYVCMCWVLLVHTEWRGRMINRSGVRRAVVENEAGGVKMWTKCGPLEKGMANPFNIVALITP